MQVRKGVVGADTKPVLVGRYLVGNRQGWVVGICSSSFLNGDEVCIHGFGVLVDWPCESGGRW